MNRSAFSAWSFLTRRPQSCGLKKTIGIGGSVVSSWLPTSMVLGIHKQGLNNLDRINMATGVQIQFDTFKDSPDLIFHPVSHT
jgi:hypothetical protein